MRSSSFQKYIVFNTQNKDINLAVVKMTPIFPKFPGTLVPFSLIRNHIRMLYWYYIPLQTIKSYTWAHVVLRKWLCCSSEVLKWHVSNRAIYWLFQKLHTIHTGFHSELQKAVSDRGGGGKHSIGECFTKWKSKFLIYGEFCSNLTKAQDLVDELCRRNPLIQSTIDVSVKYTATDNWLVSFSGDNTF